MRLTHIKLSGFKSFVDPTTISVPGQLVAVIGPNGCGKSNVIDAVRWVLGEASAKQLRGESMQDVIFNGAATRRPAARAAVELVFDNHDGTLQGAWGQYAEVAIKRQLTRQGESSYYINNQPVRRRDITDLFLGTGVGARGYAVIEQGMISRIIEARPEELRAYIEEAAGVSKYKERRRETETRLKDTREHLQRLADLQSELNRQVEKLQRQAKTAERYRSLKDELAAQQDLLDYVQWQQALAAADSATAAHQQHKSQQDHLAAQAQELAETAHTLQQTEQAQQQNVHEHNNRRALLREQWARLEEQIRHRQLTQQRFERDKAQAQSQLQRLHQQQQQLAEEAEALNIQLEEQQLALEEWAMQVAEQEALLPELEQRAHHTALAQQNQQDQHNRLQRELALKQQQQRHAEHSLQQLAQRQQRLQHELAALNLPADTELDTARHTAEHSQTEVATLEHALAECEAQWAHWQQQRQHTEAEQQQQQHQLVAIQAQHQALQALLPSAESGQDFWQHTGHAEAPALWQHIHVAETWRHAVAVALGQRLQARHIDHFTPPQPLPAGAAAWLHPHRHAEETGTADSLCQHIRSQAPFQAALQQWLGHIRCASKLENALAQQSQLAAHQAWITPEGHWVDRAGVVLYHADNQDNLLQRRARISELAAAAAELEAPLAANAAALARCVNACDNASAQRHQLQTQLKQQQQQLQAALSHAAELMARTNQGQLRREHIRQELAQIEQELAVHQHSQAQNAGDNDTLSEALATLDAQQHDLHENNQQQQQALKQAQLAALEARRQHGLAEMATHRLQQQRQHIAQQQQAAEQQSEEWQERQSELALAWENDSHSDEQQTALETLNSQIEAANEHYLTAQNQLNHTQRQQQTLYQQQQTLSQQLPAAQEAVQQALLQQQEALLNAKRFHDNLHARQADTEALAYTAAHTQADTQTLSQHIGELAQRLNGLGSVNLAALDELNEADERSRYYAEQSADVEAAMALLQEAIAQIDEETKSRFKTTFDAVNAKVQTFFPTLFGGGEASLTMVGDDLLSAGVSIMARPPGKKNSTIHLLSGGEKALTAMSLVFALFSLNPAPFCLLDEVDAPLDDANTGRFCNLVKEMALQTQFLYISHNRLTMEMAEQLVGVTMQEKGVSRIVAVDIQQALSMAHSA